MRNHHPEIAMEVRRAPRSRWGVSRFLVFADGRTSGIPRRRNELLPLIEWGINGRLIATRDDFLQLHAASLVRDGKGLVLVGPSGVGKSTLAASLLARGWEYFCDEFALIEPRTLRLQPFPKAICIKAGAFRLLRERGLPFAGRCHYVKGLKGKVAYINPRDIRPSIVGEPAPIRCIVFPKFVPDAEAQLFPVSRARAAFFLISSALNARRFGGEAIAHLCAVARGAACFGLISGSLDESCAHLEAAMESIGEPSEKAVVGREHQVNPRPPSMDTISPVM
jgi:hypothetical protein